MERADFLERIRTRLDGAAGRVGDASAGAPRGTDQAVDAWARSAPAPPPSVATPDSLQQVFLERQAELGVHAQTVATRADAEAAIVRLLADNAWSVACRPGLLRPLPSGVRAAPAAQAAFGLCEVWRAIAEIGSVVVRTGGGERRDTSLLPPVAGFIVPRSRLVARLGDVLRALAAGGVPVPTCLTLITGPSASADIVGIRTLGVHGPGEVHLWLIENE